MLTVTITKSNADSAEFNITEKKVHAVGRDGERIFVEYTSNSEETREVIIFQVQDGSPVTVWHDCQARQSGYSRGCWHLGLAGPLFGITPPCTVEIISPPDQLWCREDVSEKYLKRPGDFQLLDIKPLGGRPPIVFTGEKFLGRYIIPEPLLKRVEAFRERQMARLTDEQKSRVPQNVDYIPQGNELTYSVAALLYDTWAPPLLMGPAGSGKSTLAEALAEILYLPMRKISGGIDVNADYLLGSKTLSPVSEVSSGLCAKLATAAAKSGNILSPEEFATVKQKLTTSVMKVVHEPGVLLQAVTDGEMILVDEANILIPEVTSLLHSLLDWQRCITVPGVGEVKAHPDFRLVAAMNIGYMGTRPLNQAFRDRFRGVQVPGVTSEVLKQILSKYADSTACNTLAEIYQRLFDSVYSPTGATLTESCISVRALIRAAEEISLGIGDPKDIVTSCLTEFIEDESERTRVFDLVSMHLL